MVSMDKEKLASGLLILATLIIFIAAAFYFLLPPLKESALSLIGGETEEEKQILVEASKQTSFFDIFTSNYQACKFSQETECYCSLNFFVPQPFIVQIQNNPSTRTTSISLLNNAEISEGTFSETTLQPKEGESISTKTRKAIESDILFIGSDLQEREHAETSWISSTTLFTTADLSGTNDIEPSVLYKINKQESLLLPREAIRGLKQCKQTSSKQAEHFLAFIKDFEESCLENVPQNRDGFFSKEQRFQLPNFEEYVIGLVYDIPAGQNTGTWKLSGIYKKQRFESTNQQKTTLNKVEAFETEAQRAQLQIIINALEARRTLTIDREYLANLPKLQAFENHLPLEDQTNHEDPLEALSLDQIEQQEDFLLKPKQKDLPLGLCMQYDLPEAEETYSVILDGKSFKLLEEIQEDTFTEIRSSLDYNIEFCRLNNQDDLTLEDTSPLPTLEFSPFKKINFYVSGNNVCLYPLTNQELQATSTFTITS